MRAPIASKSDFTPSQQEWHHMSSLAPIDVTQQVTLVFANTTFMACRQEQRCCCYTTAGGGMHAGTRRVVPDNVDDKHLFQDWHCSIHTWCKGPQQRRYHEFQNCNDGKTNSRLIRAHLAALVVQCDQDTAPISETAPPTASNLDFGTALSSASNLDFGTDVLQDPTS
jgi:hypothetical protein